MNRNRHCLRWGLLLTVLAAAVVTASASERWRTLQAINWVENPRNTTKAGPHGELGPYQFRQRTWSMYTNKPFALATEREAADEVAVRHYEWIKRSLLGAGIEPTPYRIALVWNAGLDQVLNDRVPASSYAYAEQVANLAAVLESRDVASAR